MWDPLRPAPPAAAYSNFVQNLTTAVSNSELLTKEELLEMSRECLRGKASMNDQYKYVVSKENEFLSFVLGRVRHKHPSLMLAENEEFGLLFMNEVKIVAQQMYLNPFRVPFLQRAKVSVQSVRAIKLHKLLEDDTGSWLDNLKRKLAAQATSMFRIFSKNRYSSEAEKACVGKVLKTAVEKVIDLVGPHSLASISMIERTVTSQMSKLLSKLSQHHRMSELTLHRETVPIGCKDVCKRASINTVPLKSKEPCGAVLDTSCVAVVPPCRRVEVASLRARTSFQMVKKGCVLYRLGELNTEAIKKNMLARARAHFQMLKMMNKEASKLLGNVSLDDFLEKMFATVAERVTKEMPGEMAPLSKIESAMKSEVEILFEKLIKHHAGLVENQCNQSRKISQSSSFLSIRSDLLAVPSASEEGDLDNLNVCSDQNIKGTEKTVQNSLTGNTLYLPSDPSDSLTLIAGDQQGICSAKPTPKKDPEQQRKCGKRRVGVLPSRPRSFPYVDDPLCSETNSTHSSALTDEVLKNISSASCPMANCLSFFRGGIISLRHHLAEDHFYQGFREALSSRGQLEHCDACNQDLPAGMWLEHHSRHHRLLDDQIQHLLLFSLGGLDVKLQCPFCLGFYISSTFSRKNGLSSYLNQDLNLKTTRALKVNADPDLGI